MKAARALLLAAWFGGGLFLAVVAAPAAFRASGSAAAAADVVGAMLTRWHYLAIGAPLLLLISEWRREQLARTARVTLLAVALIAAAGQAAADLRIRAIRNASPVPISQLARTDPVRRSFGRLHGVSTLLLLVQIVGAGGVVATGSRQKTARIEM